MAFCAAQPVHQVFRHHQEIGDAVQPTGQLIGIQLIDCIERLKLDPGAPIQLRKADLLMYFRDNRFRPAVPVSITGQHRFTALHQHIIHAPGIDGQAFDFRINLQRFIYPSPDMGFQCIDVPGQMAIIFSDAVRKTIDLFHLDLSILHPTDDVAAG